MKLVRFLLMSLYVFAVIDASAETVPTGLTCRDSLVSLTVDGIERVESTRLCVDLWTRPSGRSEIRAIASENCVKTKKETGDCFAVKKAREAPSRKQNVLSKLIASSGFDLCLRLGGEPASLRFQLGGQLANLSSNHWQVTDRCLFSEDFSYIDLQSLSDYEASPFITR